MLGLEIRKIGSLGNLYKDVDRTLERVNSNFGNVGDGMKVSAVAHSLQKMLRSNYFCVLAVKDCAKLVGIVISSERLDFYRSVHCINYSDMLPEFRQGLIAMVLDDFRTILNPTEDTTHEIVTTKVK